MNTETKIKIGLAAFAFMLCVACPIAGGLAYTALQQFIFPVTANTESSDYYRGVYDMCGLAYMYSGGTEDAAIEYCNGMADNAKDWTDREPIPADDEAAYYRGVYDSCFMLFVADGGDLTVAPKVCEEMTNRATKNDWWGQPSKGYEQ